MFLKLLKNKIRYYKHLNAENKMLKKELFDKDILLHEIRITLRNIKECSYQNTYRKVSKKEQPILDYRLNVIREQIDKIEELIS